MSRTGVLRAMRKATRNTNANGRYLRSMLVPAKIVASSETFAP